MKKCELCKENDYYTIYQGRRMCSDCAKERIKKDCLRVEFESENWVEIKGMLHEN